MPLFDFATFKTKGLSPRDGAEEDGIHQMPETALYEMYSMLDFVKESRPGSGRSAPGREG